MKTALEDLPRLTVKDMARAGVFDYSTRVGGVMVRWRNEAKPVYFHREDNTIVFRAMAGNGARIETRIGIIARPTNLGIGTMWLFESSIIHEPCRVLYLVRGMMVSRGEIVGARYRQQLKSRAGRLMMQSNKYRNPPERLNGKTTYRGKPTPYGKRLERYGEKFEDLELRLAQYLVRRFRLARIDPELSKLL